MGHIVVATSAPVRLEPFVPLIRLIHSTQLQPPGRCPVNGVANFAGSTMGTTKDTVGNVAESACGLIQEFGAVVCSIFKELIEVAYNYVSPQAMKIVISNVMHGGLDQGINEIAKAYIQRYDPRQARQNLGTFASIVNAFPTREVVIGFATRDRSTKEMQLALFDYNDSVRQFAEVAARR